MQNKEERKFTRKHGAVLMLSLCLTGAAAFGTYYTLNHFETEKEQQEQVTELEEEEKIQDANAAKNVTAKDTAENAEAENGIQEMEVNNADAEEDMQEDPEDLLVSQQESTLVDNSEEDAEEVAGSDVTASLGHVLEGEPVISSTLGFNFDENSALDWPVAGTVLLDYSMDASIYFPTLNVYKYNPALVIGAEVGSQVAAAADGVVESIEVLSETGTTMTVNAGNGYQIVYGQLKEVPVAVGDTVEAGTLLGYVSEPTKYYCEEGSNLYFKMMKDGEPVDPFLYLGE